MSITIPNPMLIWSSITPKNRKLIIIFLFVILIMVVLLAGLFIILAAKTGNFEMLMEMLFKAEEIATKA